MSRKWTNTLTLLAVFIVIAVGGYSYIYFMQVRKIDAKNKQIKELSVFDYSPDLLTVQLQDRMDRVKSLDSVLSSRKFNIPFRPSERKFYEFMTKLSYTLSDQSTFDIEYQEDVVEKPFSYQRFTIDGRGYFNDLYKVVYAIEQSKEFKKIKKLTLNNTVKVAEDQVPHFLVSYKIDVSVYYSDVKDFAPIKIQENNLVAEKLYDVFFPLVRTEIPPNLEGLLEVQGAKLMSILPDGAYLVDKDGESFMLKEWDEVYLGTVTEINREKNSITFMLNIGGVVETITTELERSKIEKKK